MSKQTHDYALERIKSDHYIQREAFGMLLREKRKKLRLTQKKMSDLIGIDYSQISRWEMGRTLPRDQQTVDAIIQYYRLSQSEADELQEVVFGNRVASQNTPLLKSTYLRMLGRYGLKNFNLLSMTKGIIVVGSGKLVRQLYEQIGENYDRLETVISSLRKGYAAHYIEYDRVNLCKIGMLSVRCHNFDEEKRFWEEFNNVERLPENSKNNMRCILGFPK